MMSAEVSMNLEECLPADLQGPSTTITKIAAGLSGAGVYRVDAGEQTFVLKISDAEEPLDAWRYKLDIRQLAGDAGLTPVVLHVDEVRRAILSAFVVDRSFPAFYGNPRTREAALAQLGRTLRRVHELPVPTAEFSRDPREFLRTLWSGPLAPYALPSFVGDAVQRVLTEEAPAPDRGLVLSHNDVNPSNLVYDGENLLLLDWETAGPNDPLYDLAAISVFMRMGRETCQRLLSAYDGAPESTLPARFAYNRRLVAVLCGVLFLHLAHRAGHPGATGEETLTSTLSLGDFYQRMMAGALSPATAEGQWYFGLALIKESVAEF
jgi:aminoglycoside phosphotransferase (APT) family kinase protein